MLNSNESPLHRAVLEDDYKSVEALSKINSLLNATNFLGFTALEIAHYLGKQACEKILSSNEETKPILLMKPGTNCLEPLNRAQFKSFFHVNYCAHLFFPDYLFLQQVLKGCPWAIRKHLKNENILWRQQHQKELSKGMVTEVAIQWIDETLGYGLFALQDIPENAFIGEYTGLVRHLSLQNPDKNAYCVQYPNLFNTVVDALAYGNETRFINHSDTPNLQPLWTCECNMLHFFLITKMPIQAGTQLTFDYGKSFWMHRQKIQI